MSSFCITIFGSHKYEARYDEVEIPGALKTIINNGFLEMPNRDKYIRKVYIQDVCRHCGDTIDRLDKEPNVK